METRTFTIHGVLTTFTELHTAGDLNCTADFCGNEGYPYRCKCGGLVHAAVDAETFNDTYGGVDEKCDGCDDPRSALFDDDDD
jgi:hypothetical protein